MSQTASGFLRVALLLIATASLALVWTGDQQTQQQFIVARKAATQHTQGILLAKDVASSRAALVPTMAPSKVNRTTPGLRSVHTAQSVAASADNSFIARVEIELSLPIGIAPGRYQVVDQTGSVRTIHVRSTSGLCERQDVYSLMHPDGTREFFIRLNDLTAASDDVHAR